MPFLRNQKRGALGKENRESTKGRIHDRVAGVRPCPCIWESLDRLS